MVEEDSESKNTDSKENDIPKEEEGTNVGDFSSNLDGYSERKGKSGKEDKEENNEENSEQGNTNDEGNHTNSSVGEKEMEKFSKDQVSMREENQMVKTTSPTREVGEEDKNEDPITTREEE